MNTPEISIIVPVYKVEKYLEQCLVSILSQSFTDFEVILVDDGSPDRCPQVCDEYARMDKRVVAFHKVNGGLSSARNYGLDRARGNYIVFVDSDDCMGRDALGEFHAEIIRSDADVALGRVVRFSEDGTQRPYTRLSERRVFTGLQALSEILKGSDLNIGMWTGMYRREVFSQLRMPEGWICEDWYISPEIYLNVRKVVYTPHLWYLYRENPQSIMADLSRRCNPQVIQVAHHVVSVIQTYDHSLYLHTLWSNLKRVWKYVGIIYQAGRQKEEMEFLGMVKNLLKVYEHDLYRSGEMNFQETVGVWSFCHSLPLFRCLTGLKSKTQKLR